MFTVRVKEQNIKQVSPFSCLGSPVTEDAKCVAGIKRRIALANSKTCISKIGYIFRNCKMSMSTRFCVGNCYVYPVLCYGGVAWTLTADLKKRPESCEMWF